MRYLARCQRIFAYAHNDCHCLFRKMSYGLWSKLFVLCGVYTFCLVLPLSLLGAQLLLLLSLWLLVRIADTLPLVQFTFSFSPCFSTRTYWTLTMNTFEHFYAFMHRVYLSMFLDFVLFSLHRFDTHGNFKRKKRMKKLKERQKIYSNF